MLNALFIGFSILILTLVVVAFIDCIRKRPPRWPWWLVFILLGFVSISLDLTSGNISIEPLSVLVLGVKVMRNGGGAEVSWIIGVSIPVAALLWFARGRRQARVRQSTSGVAKVS